MKKTAILGFIILSTFSCKAQQIVPVEKKLEYMKIEDGIPESITYFKDVNNILNKYLGVWKGTYDNNKYEFRIVKITEKPGRITEDRLLIRYIITDAKGVLIENTTTLPNSNYLVIRGDYIDRSSYLLNYVGRDGNCGQMGTIFIGIVKNSNNTQMKLTLEPEHILISPKDCQNKGNIQIMPTNQITVTKQ